MDEKYKPVGAKDFLPRSSFSPTVAPPGGTLRVGRPVMAKVDGRVEIPICLPPAGRAVEHAPDQWAPDSPQHVSENVFMDATTNSDSCQLNLTAPDEMGTHPLPCGPRSAVVPERSVGGCAPGQIAPEKMVAEALGLIDAGGAA